MKHFLHGFLVLQAFRLCAFGQVLLYQENFPYPGPSGSLPVSSFGWSNAIPNNPNRLYQLSGTNGAVFAYQGDTDVPISTAFFTTTTLDSGATGMAFPSFNPAQFTGLTLSADIQPYYLPDSIAARFAVQMNGANWFAAATALPVPTTVGGFATYTQAFNPAATFWNSLTIRSTNAVIGVVATSNLLGNITGAGLVFTHTVHGGTHNFDNFLITATGQFNPTNAPSLTITFSDVGQAPWNVTNFGKIPENYQPGELLGSGILTHWINVGGYTGGPDHTTGTGFSAREYNGGISPSIVLFNQHVVVRSVFVDAFNGQGTHIYVRGYTYSNSPVPVITVDVPTRSHPWGGGYQWIQVTNLDGIPLQKLVVESSVYGDNAQFDDITIQPAPTNNIPPRDFLYNKLTIMPLGDSITWGVDAPGGFRTKLYQNLKRAGYDFTFIGSDTTNPGPLPLPQDQQAREGHPGYTISQDNSNLDANVPPYPTDNDSNNGGYWLTRLNRPPDIILIHLGTNDIGGGGNVTPPPRTWMRCSVTFTRSRRTRTLLSRKS